jgi:hypothetical protein
VFTDWGCNAQRVIKNAKNAIFLQSLTRDISQTNEPISEKLRRIEDQVTLNMYDENIWNRAETKNVTLGGIFKIPTKLSPKPRILGTKNFKSRWNTTIGVHH